MPKRPSKCDVVATEQSDPLHALLLREWLPVEGGELGFLLLVVAVAIHLAIAALGPDSQGHLFRGGVLTEALGQSVLLILPFLSVYAGWRSRRRDRDAPLPYLTLAGGGLLGMVTLVSCCVALLAT